MMIYKIKAKLTGEEMAMLNWMLEVVDLLEPLNKRNTELANSIKSKMKVKEVKDDKTN